MKWNLRPLVLVLTSLCIMLPAMNALGTTLPTVSATKPPVASDQTLTLANDGSLNSNIAIVSITVMADTNPPTGSILVDGGAASARTTAVVLNLSAADTGGSGLASMRFRNSTADPYSAWEPYQTTRSWSLTSEAGKKKVYVQFMDGAGNISDANPAAAGAQGYSDAIELLEEIASPTGSILINGGAASTTTTAVILNLSASDTGGSGLASMRFRNSTADPYSAWEPYQTTRSWLLVSGAGTKKVYVQFMEEAGNVSDANPAAAGAQGYSDSILLDASPLPTGSILINDGAASTSSATVTLRLSANDNGGGGLGWMRFRNSSEDSYCAWETFHTSTAWLLSSGSGIKSVYVQFMDLEGNISDADPAAAGSQGYTDEILFDDPNVPTTCEGCHGGNPDYPLAPNVMGDGIDPSGTGSTPKPYDDGSWGYNVSGHGANGMASVTFDTNKSVSLTNILDPDAACDDCHTLESHHNNGVLNSAAGGSPQANTYHLSTTGTWPFLQAGDTGSTIQTRFDSACYNRCHVSASPAVVNMRHAFIAPPVSQFGKRGSLANGEDIHGRTSPAWPIDSDLTTSATTTEPDYVPCVSCHEPHGTNVSEPGYPSNRMMRAKWQSENTLCYACHQ